uniref:Probable acetate kinase n=1 Tax=Chaetoceros debilis TaxID=122233 RepID=A0A7S3QDJ0_9STRA
MHSRVKTILIVNSGSSSVKASLLCPSSGTGEEADGGLGIHSDAGRAANETTEQKEKRKPSVLSPPVRLLTAHAEMLGSPGSSLTVNICTSAISKITERMQHQHPDTTSSSSSILCRSEGLLLTPRAAAGEFDHPRKKKRGVPRPLVNAKKFTMKNMSHQWAIETIVERMILMCGPQIMQSITAIGHRVVHGGDQFSADATIVTESVLKAIENISHLAPLHNPSNILGIKIAQRKFKNVPNIVVFDTSFHTTMPRYIKTYPLPAEYAQHQIRKYGFHGISVKYVYLQASARLATMGKRFTRMIIAHLGNGASATAVVNGQSVDTTMGFTPLSGTMMGTRSGSVDPSIVTYASKEMGKSAEEVLEDLNKRSGLHGISKGDHDMREIMKKASKGNVDAQLAIGMYVHILAKHIAGLIVSCGGDIDALVFTAGIGEHCYGIRNLTVKKLDVLLRGVQLDNSLNLADGRNSDGLISVDNDADRAGCAVLVIPTDEEAMICYECEMLAQKNI